MNELKNIPLKDITMLTNYREVEPVSEKDPDIIELSKDIIKNDVLQAVLVRPAKKAGTYELIFGRRRYVASKVANKESIPATIKEVKDDEILEYQVTENLQRKDVHPMDEAIAFKSLMDKKGYKIEEVAARFAKKPDFVAQRIKLNDLVPEGQKLFKSNKMLLGHAILICRLPEADQNSIIKNRRDYGSVSDLNDYITRNIVRDLSKASFDTKDATLFPQAGACTNCPKQSGCNTLLFADMKGPNRCFDQNCFSTKAATAFLKNLQDVVETKPDVVLVKSRHDSLPKSVNDYVQKMNVKVITDGEGCSSHTYSGSSFKVKAKGFYLNGYNAGKFETIYLKGKGSDAKGGEAKETSAVVAAGIKERLARAKVLDSCKVHTAIIDEVKKKPELTKKPHKLQPVDRGIMVYLLLKSANLDGRYGDALKGLPAEPREKGYQPEYFQKLSKIPDDVLALVIRKVVSVRFANQNLQWGIDTDDTPIKLIADYLGVDTAAIQSAQAELAEKREKRAKERIAALGKQKKEKKKAAPKKSAVKKLAKKK